MKQLSEHDMALLSALLDDALPSAEADALRQRLQQDAALRDALVDLTLTRDAMRAMPVVQPPRSLRIDPARLTQARGWRWWLIMPPAGQLIPTMAVTLSLCICIIFGQQALISSSNPDILKGVADVELMAPNAAIAPASSDMAAESRIAEAQPGADPASVAVAPELQVVAPAPAHINWWWAATSVAALASLSSAVWAWRVAQRRRVVLKR
jgi:hypothetical protein